MNKKQNEKNISGKEKALTADKYVWDYIQQPM